MYEVRPLKSSAEDAKEIALSVARLVSQKLSCETRVVSFDEIPHARMENGNKHRSRAYIRTALITSQGSEISVFVKQAPDQACSKADETLAERMNLGFKVPKFYGAFEISNLKFAVWEYIETAKYLNYSEFPHKSLLRLIDAIAAINMVIRRGSVSAEELGVRKNIRRINVPVRWFKKHQDDKEIEGGVWGDLRTRTTRILEQRERIISQLIEEGDDFLCHNDLSARNVLLPDASDPVIVDWISASLSVPGADLSFLEQLNRDVRDELYLRYISTAATFGTKLSYERVRFASQMLRAFLLLHRGWKHKSIQRIEAALRIAEPLLEKRAKGKDK